MVNAYVPSGLLSQLRVVSGPLDHPEGLTVGPDGTWYAGTESGFVFSISPSSGQVTRLCWLGDMFVSGMCADAGGCLYVCAGAAVFRVDPDGVVDEYSSGSVLGPYVAPNWPTFQANGWMWLTDSGDDSSEEATGKIFLIPPGGGPGRLVGTRPLAYPNMSALAIDGISLLVAESRACRVIRVTIDGGAETVAELPGCIVDGIAATSDGGFVVSHFQPNEIASVSASGTITSLVSDWTGLRLLTPTSIAFFGPDMNQLLISSLAGCRLQALATSLTGLGLRYPHVSGRA